MTNKVHKKYLEEFKNPENCILLIKCPAPEKCFEGCWYHKTQVEKRRLLNEIKLP